jgi:divalent metal cation (Fe/Co/Zn/Cd) transporter
MFTKFLRFVVACVVVFLALQVTLMLFPSIRIPRIPGAPLLVTGITFSILLVLIALAVYHFTAAMMERSITAQARQQDAQVDQMIRMQFCLETVPAVSAGMARGHKKYLRWWTPRRARSLGHVSTAHLQVCNPNGLSD